MESQPRLVRAIGRWSMVALAINSILGSGIFGLPSVLAGQVGGASPLAVLLAGVAMTVIVVCYAEVASQFSGSGGTYLYVRATFGRLAGLEVGWLSLLARLTSGAAALNLFVTYLGEFFPAVTGTAPRIAVATLLVGTLGLTNYRGVGGAALLSSASVIAKLVPLALVSGAGVLYLTGHAAAAPAVASSPSWHDWLSAILLLFFAYGGYEAALNPLGEAKDPRRDAPFALLVAIAVLTLLYYLLQLTVMHVLPDPAGSMRPLADAARVMMGPAGAVLIALAALVSVYGYLSANMLTVPRSLFALAECGDFPAWFGAVHARFRTPHLSILAYALLLWLFSVLGSFSWNVTLSAVSRLCYFAAVCAAVPVLRRRQPEASRFKVPGGVMFAALGIVICLMLLTAVDFSKSAILAATVIVALLNWVVVRGRA